MRKAAIDLGTNSTRLFIADLSNNKIFSILRRTEITRLGEGVAEKRILKPEAINRTLKIVAEYKHLCQQYQIQAMKVAATSAVREAQNTEKFLAQVKDRLGLKVEVLTGEKEAQLAFLGATYDLAHQPSAISHQLLLVIDIGGGSTELILGIPPKVDRLFSLDIGCVRLTEKFIRSDPPKSNEVIAARNYLKKQVQGPIEAIAQVKQSSLLRGVGVAGTITSLSAIKQKLKEYDTNKVHGSKLTREEIGKILEKLQKMTTKERKKIPSLEPKRADIIVAGTLILHQLLKMLNLDKITVSEKDILDGLILS